MANENVNLANRLNNVKNIISNFESFQEFFNKSDERNQKAIINILENLPKDIKEYGKSFTENLRINYVILNLFGDNGSGLCSENINIAINGELILQDFRNKGYISSKESYELSQTMRELLRGGMSYYLNNSNAKEFVDFLQKNRNSDSLKKDNSCLFDEGKRLLKKNEVEILKEKNLEEERDKKFEDILKETKENQPDKYDLVSKIMSVAAQYDKSRYIKDALLESYEKNAANGNKDFDMGINKTIESIIDKIIYLNSGINVDLKNFLAMAIALNPEDQNKLNKILKIRNNEYKNKFITEVMNLYKNGDTKKMDMVINIASLVQKLYEQGDFNLKECEEFSQRIKLAQEKFAKHKNLTSNFQKIIINFSTYGEKGRDNINKVCEILEKVPQKYAERFTADLINLDENGATERKVIVINKEFLLLQLRERGDFTQDDRRRFSQTVNGLDDNSAKLLLNKVGNALKNNESRERIMSLINEKEINNQHRPLQMVKKANNMQVQNKSQENISLASMI